MKSTIKSIQSHSISNTKPVWPPIDSLIRHISHPWVIFPTPTLTLKSDAVVGGLAIGEKRGAEEWRREQVAIWVVGGAERGESFQGTTM